MVVFEKLFRITDTISMKTMCAYNSQKKICKYKSVKDILQDFYDIRIIYY